MWGAQVPVVLRLERWVSDPSLRVRLEPWSMPETVPTAVIRRGKHQQLPVTVGVSCVLLHDVHEEQDCTPCSVELACLITTVRSDDARSRPVTST